MSDATVPTEATPTTSDLAHTFDTSWIDRTAYPFESKCLGLTDGAVHYVDEGPEEPRATLLMLHGNPTWSFLYRHLVSGLSDTYRCVALDYLGFGLSEHPPDFDYRPSSHARVVAEFVEELGLTDVVLVGQDWGGPIGLSYALDHPENVRGLVLMNTWMWPVDDVASYRRFSWLLGGPIGRRLCERYNVFGRYVMRLGFGDRSKFTPEAHRHYLEPHADPARRTGTWVFPRAIVGETEWLRSLWAKRETIADHPVRLIWGMEDTAFGPEELRTFEALFSDPSVVRVRGVGHYVQEELGPDLVPYVRAFLERLD